MANQVVNRSVNIFIESGQAQKALDALIKKEEQLKAALIAATNPKEIAKLKDELEKLQEPIDRIKKKLSGELAPSFRDVQATANSLGLRLKHMSEEDADYSKVVAQYRQANKELDEQRGKVGLLHNAMRSFWQEAKTVAVGVVIGNTIQTALQTVLGYVTGIVTGSAKLSDELADIQRITGLQKNEVSELNSELKKIDTRSSTSSLRDIAIIAGKLGTDGKENIRSFVQAVDELNIAMGGELGDVEQFTTELGKILNVFEGKITAKKITEVGNAIVTLANDGVATGPFITDFTQRIAAIAKSSNLSLDAVIGLAAGIEDSGLKVESSATAIQKILIDIASDVPKAAKVAGVEFEQFNKQFSEKPQEALLLYAKGLVANKQSFSEVTAAFQDQGLEGSRVISTLQTLGQKTEFFENKMKLAGEAIKDTTAITAAFELKNNTAGAELDKFKKNFAGIFQSKSFQEAGETAIRLMNSFVNVLKGIPEFISDNTFALSTLTVGLLLMNKATIASGVSSVYFRTMKIFETAVVAASTLVTNIARASMVAYTIAVNILAGRLTVLRGAQLLWNAVMAAGAGPIGAVLVGVGALVIGIGKLFSGTKQITAQEKLRNELTSKTAELLGDQAANVERLAKSAANENLQLSARNKAIEDLIKINPEFEHTLKINTQGHLEGAEAIATYIKVLNKKAEAEARTSLLTEKIREKQNLINEIRANQPGLANASDESIITITSKLGAKQGFDVADKFKELKQQIDVLNDGIANDANEAFAAVKKPANDATKDVKEVVETIETLKIKLKQLEAERDTTPKGTRHTQILKEIEIVEKKIAELEGKTDKATTKAESDIAKLERELQKIKENLSLSSMSFLERELGELDFKYAKLAERAKGNNKLLLIVQELYEQERLQVIRAASRKEVDAWEKSQEDIRKKQDETFKKNIDAVKAMQARLETEFNNSAADAINAHDRNRLAGDELAVMKAHGKERLKAELVLLDEQERQELDKKGLTENEKLLIEEKFRQARKDAEIQHYVELADLVLGWANQVMNIYGVLSKSKTDSENADLDRDRKVNEKKKANLEKRLKSGTISQLNYQRELDKLDKEQEKKEKVVKEKQFRRDQKAQMLQALMSGFQGVTSVLAARPGSLDVISLGAFRAINIGLTIAATAAQVAAIAKQKPPEFGSGGAYLKGPAHSDVSKGMPVINPYTGQVHAYMEGGEGIGSKKTMNDKRNYKVEGTPSQIYSLLNGINGGTQWTTGAVVRPAWSTIRPQQINYGAVNSSVTTMKRFYAGGGQFNSTTTAPVKPDGGNIPPELIAAMKDIAATNSALHETLTNIQNDGIPAYMLITQFEKQQQRLQDIRKDATMKG